LKDKFTEEDKSTILNETAKCSKWLDENQHATTEEYEQHERELEAV